MEGKACFVLCEVPLHFAEKQIYLAKVVSILIFAPHTGIKKKVKISWVFTHQWQRYSLRWRVNIQWPDLGLTYHKGSFSSLQRSEHESMIPPGINPTDGQLTIMGVNAVWTVISSGCRREYFWKKISTEQDNVYLPASIREKNTFQ